MHSQVAPVLLNMISLLLHIGFMHELDVPERSASELASLLQRVPSAWAELILKGQALANVRQL